MTYQDETTDLEALDAVEGTDMMDRLDRVPMRPNQLDGLGCSNPEDALNELIDLKNGYLEV